MQTRMDAEIVVFFRSKSRKPGDQKYGVQNVRQKSSQTIRNQNQNQNSRVSDKD